LEIVILIKVRGGLNLPQEALHCCRNVKVSSPAHYCKMAAEESQWVIVRKSEHSQTLTFIEYFEGNLQPVI
jgi:hypothetical protein